MKCLVDVIDNGLMFRTLSKSRIGISFGIDIRPRLSAYWQSWFSFYFGRHRQEDADNV